MVSCSPLTNEALRKDEQEDSDERERMCGVELLVNFDRFIGYFNDILNYFGFVGVVIILVSDAEVERIIE